MRGQKSMWGWRVLWLVVFATGLSIFLLNSGTEIAGQTDIFNNKKPLPKVDVAWGAKIPMRDGVKLNATIYRPSNSQKPLAAVVSITPYISDFYHDVAMFLAEQGFVFIIVDSRGRGNSEGEFEPFINEGRDGYDVIEWVARQPWCDGKVGMWGGSYSGFNQWAILKEFPPHLKTIIPIASAHPGTDLPAPQGIMDSYIARWMTLTSGVTPNVKFFGDDDYWIGKFRKRYLLHIPFQKLDSVVGNPNKHFQKWLKYRKAGPYWDAMVPGEKDYAKIDFPILTITGHYDGDQAGAMQYYHRHMKYGFADGKIRHHLIMGPWDHAGTRKPKEKLGGVTFGKLSLIEMNQLYKAWYDWTLRGKTKPVELTKRIMSYTAGLEMWKHYDRLEDIPVQKHKYYLHSNGKANDVFQSGFLREEKPGKQPFDKYVYDPLDLRPADMEKDKIEDFLTDQRYALNLFGSGLVYHSDPLPDDLEVTGYLKFAAWIKLNVPDTDFQVTVYEIQPDGKSILLSQDRLRARHRESMYQEKLIKPGEIHCYKFQCFNFISRVLKKGSRLRLVVRAPNSIYMEKNYNSGGAVEAETAKDTKTAEVTLYHDDEHPSYLEVPVVQTKQK